MYAPKLDSWMFSKTREENLRWLSRSEGFPLTAYFFLGTMGTGAWPDSRVVETLSSSAAAADFSSKMQDGN